MKRQIKKLSFLLIGICVFTATQSQTTPAADSVVVNGNCGMCKKNIESSALDAGATFAFWNRRTKMLNVKYDTATTNMRKIERKIADKGYDTENFRATDEAYNQLEECCQYERGELKPGKKQ